MILTKNSLRDLTIILITTLALIFLIWTPYVLRLNSFFGLDFSGGMDIVYRNFDGLEYVIIAKSFYFPTAIAALPQTLSANYFASHFPGYSLFILLFSPVLGFLKSMLFTSIAFTILSAWAFYFLVRDFKLSEHPLWLSLVFLVLPARWLTVHSVGSSEPTFIFFIIGTLYMLLKFEAVHKYRFVVLASFLGAAAQLTRPPGALLTLAIFAYLIWKLIKDEGSLGKKLIGILKNYFPLLLIPLSLLGIFYWFFISYHDFFAYFHSGDNIHLMWPPFQVFNKHEFWVGDIWLEDIVYIFVLGFLGGLLLLKRKLHLLGIFVLTYLIASIMVVHRDISRYTLPAAPFILIAFEKVLVSREFKIVLAIVALGIYLYSQNFILNNTAPITNINLFN